MKTIKGLSDWELATALRHCVRPGGCDGCPVEYNGICGDKIRFEAANRLERILAICAERDAYKKELIKRGVNL